MYGRYLANHPLLRLYLHVSDGIAALLAKHHSREIGGLALPPRRLLLCNGAHMGDVVISSGIVGVLRHLLPETRLGFLTGSWSRPVVDHIPHLSWHHELDHTKLNRSGNPLGRRILQHVQSRRRVLREISDVGYDVAVDLYPFFPNSAWLLAKAGIPTRIGFASGGGGPLLTHSMDFHDDNLPMAQLQSALLDSLPVDRARLQHLRDNGLPPCLISSQQKVAASLPERGYVVVHTGTGAPAREWAEENWLALIRRLAADGHQILLTGHGDRECNRAARLVEKSSTDTGTSITNLCGQLRLDDLLGVIGRARLLIGVESLAGHLGAALDTPSVILWSGTSNIYQWHPNGRRLHVLQMELPCKPCFRAAGCATMECMMFTVESVYQVCCDRLSNPDLSMQITSYSLG
ncbi:MAG: glycosyltransferase family 9 protein [Magnetococcus sp. WYHC-3]